MRGADDRQVDAAGRALRGEAARRQERHHHHRRVGEHRDRHRARRQPVQPVGQVDGVGATGDDQEQQHVVDRPQLEPHVDQRQVHVGGQVLAVRRRSRAPAVTPSSSSIFQRPGQAQRAAVGELEPVVDEADRRHRPASPRPPPAPASCASSAAAKVSSAQASRNRPPIVGVPCLDMCPAGPSSRICCPSARRRTNAMNSRPDRDRQQHRDHARQQHQLHGAIASTTASRPIDRLPLTSTASPGAEQVGRARSSASSRVANQRAAVAAGQRPDRRSPARCRARPPASPTCAVVSPRPSGPELGHVAQHRDRPAAVRRRPPGGAAPPRIEVGLAL